MQVSHWMRKYFLLFPAVGHQHSGREGFNTSLVLCSCVGCANWCDKCDSAWYNRHDTYQM